MFDIKNIDIELKQFYLSEDFCDFYRLVEPTTHIVYNYADKKLIKMDYFCYDIWGLGVPCINCISKHACQCTKKYYKLEFLDGIIYFITAFPIKLNGMSLSLELIKNVTDSMFVSNHTDKRNEEIQSFVSRFNHMVVHDSFTGLYNKTFINDEIENTLDQINSLHQHVNVVCALIDIDQFKNINDTYGHYMGDIVIKRISDILKNYTYSSRIWAGRLGGDEFCIFFKNYTLEEAQKKCNIIKQNINNQEYFKGSNKFTVTVSMGIAPLYETDNLQTFLDKLDTNLYAEKNRKKLQR